MDRGLCRAQLTNQIVMELMKDTDRTGQLIFSVLSLPDSFASVAQLPLSRITRLSV